MLCNFSCFCGHLLTFQKNYFINSVRVSNYMDPFQAQCSVGLIWVQTVCKGYHKTTNSPLAQIKAIVGIKCCEIFYNSQRIQGGPEPRFIFFFLKTLYIQISSLLTFQTFWNTIKVSNSSDLDQAEYFVQPDPCPNCLQIL